MSETEPFLVPDGWTRSDFIPHTGGPSYRLLFYPDATVRFEHRCNRGERGTVICAPALSPQHAVSGSHGKTTITPSILCSDCGTHGFIVAGRWTAALPAPEATS